MYVCMSQVVKRACVYVSGGGACMCVCLRWLSVDICMSQVAKRVCSYVSGS